MSASTAHRPIQILTFVVWSACACVGGLGFYLHHPWPQAHAEPIEPMMAQVAVELPPPEPELKVAPPPAPDLAPREITLHPATTAIASAPPPPLAQVAISEPPAFTPVAVPSSAIAFAVPVAGPTRIVAQEDAAAGASGSPQGSTHGTPGGVVGGTGATIGAAPAPKQLVFGEGEGKQDKPSYPREALKRRQEGSVGIRFIVDETGGVTEAEIAEPCKYPLLNLAALDVVKKSWRFPAGDKRLYQVSIRFQLSRD